MIAKITAFIAVLLIVIVVDSTARAQEDPWGLIDAGAGSQNAAFSGDFQNRTTLDLAADDEYEDYATTRELLYGKGMFTVSEKLSVTLSALAEYSFRVNEEFVENGARYRGDLEEFYADLHFGNFDLRLGQQIVSWGKTDVINPTDTINSLNMSYVIDRELGHDKIPNLMAKADYYKGPWRFEAIFIPFFRPAKVDFIGGDWALLGNRVPMEPLIGYLDESYEGRLFLGYLNRYYPSWDDELEETMSSERLNALGPQPPQDDLDYWEAAFKTYLAWGPTDWSLSYFYGFDDMPTLRFSPALRRMFRSVLEDEPLVFDLPELLSDLNSGSLLKSEYSRIHQFGGDFSANLGPSVIRAEGAYVLGRSLYNDHLKPVEHPIWTYTAAADYTLPLDIIFNLQILRMITQDYSGDLLTERAYSFLITYLRGDFFDDKFEIYTEMIYNAANWSVDDWGRGDIFGEDFQWTAKASYDFTPDFTTGFGVMVFGGPSDQMLAFLHERSFGFLDIKYSF